MSTEFPAVSTKRVISARRASFGFLVRMVTWRLQAAVVVCFSKTLFGVVDTVELDLRVAEVRQTIAEKRLAEKIARRQEDAAKKRAVSVPPVNPPRGLPFHRMHGMHGEGFRSICFTC